jgi:single-strand DNA-binding protein
MKHVGSKSTALATFTIANNRGYGDFKHVNYFDCDLWGKAAEALINYLVKGKKVAVDGELKQERWESDSGGRSKIKITVSSISLGAGGEKVKADEPKEEFTPGSMTDDDIPF